MNAATTWACRQRRRLPTKKNSRRRPKPVSCNKHGPAPHAMAPTCPASHHAIAGVQRRPSAGTLRRLSTVPLLALLHVWRWSKARAWTSVWQQLPLPSARNRAAVQPALKGTNNMPAARYRTHASSPLQRAMQLPPAHVPACGSAQAVHRTSCSYAPRRATPNRAAEALTGGAAHVCHAGVQRDLRQVLQVRQLRLCRQRSGGGGVDRGERAAGMPHVYGSLQPALSLQVHHQEPPHVGLQCPAMMHSG
jgi:hypothetical protein